MERTAHPIVLELLERCRRDHDRWINGDGTPYTLPDDGTIMGAVGGWSHGGEQTARRQAAVARAWTAGRGSVELISGGVEGDVAWLVLVERAMVDLVGEPGPRRWDLRVTEVFRRGPDGYERIHRHADPLVDRHALPAVLALLEDDPD